MIFIVFGLPGTGKTFFSKRLAEQLGAAYLNTDIIRERMNKKGLYQEHEKERVYAQLLNEMEKYVPGNSDVVIDGTFHLKSRRMRFGQKAESLGQTVFFIEIRAEEKTVKERLRAPRDHSEAGYAAYQKIRRAFEPMDEPHLILWSDKQGVQEMIDHTIRHTDG